MKMIATAPWVFLSMFLFSACDKEELSFTDGDIKIEVKTGDNWLHDYPLFLGIKKKNPPQFAIWVEDTLGNYLSTVFVTHKIATESWQANNGNRRKEALPHWCYQRGIVYDDGFMLPTKEDPLVDGISGETPINDKIIKLRLNEFNLPIVIKAEFNQSIDWNSYYPKNAAVGDDNYSGGKEGSGQPAVIYAKTIYPKTNYSELELIGHSSPSGEDGEIYNSLEKITSAKSIVEKIKVSIK